MLDGKDIALKKKLKSALKHAVKRVNETWDKVRERQNDKNKEIDKRHR